jgi:hypothetical protein
LQTAAGSFVRDDLGMENRKGSLLRGSFPSTTLITMSEENRPPLPADDEEARFDEEGSAVGRAEPAETEPPNVRDQHRQALLASSTSYMRAKFDFQHAIIAARNAGLDDAEIARVTGLTEQMITGILRSP